MKHESAPVAEQHGDSAVDNTWHSFLSSFMKHKHRPAVPVQTTHAGNSADSTDNAADSADDVNTIMRELDNELSKAGRVVTEGHSGVEASKQENDQYDQWARNTDIKTICETGFNGGHSAARFLSQSNATVYEFDLGQHDYAKTAEGFLAAKFP